MLRGLAPFSSFISILDLESVNNKLLWREWTVWSARVLDPHHPIVELVWAGKVEAHEVPEANKELEKCFKSLGGRPFDMLVDTSKLIAFTPEAQRAIVEQQKWVISLGLRRSAVVTPNNVVNMALDMTRRKSGLTEEYKFSTREEALAFLKG